MEAPSGRGIKGEGEPLAARVAFAFAEWTTISMRSPSPQPSPAGRGRIAVHTSTVGHPRWLRRQPRWVPWCLFVVESNRPATLKSRLLTSTLCLVGAALLAVAILVFTHLPNDKVPQLIIRIGDDKLRHVLSYGLFSALLFVGLRPWVPSPVKSLAWVAVSGTVFAIVDELTQPFTGRTCSLLDFIASFGGTLLGGSVMFSVTVLTWLWFSTEASPTAAPPQEAPSATATQPDRPSK